MLSDRTLLQVICSANTLDRMLLNIHSALMTLHSPYAFRDRGAKVSESRRELAKRVMREASDKMTVIAQKFVNGETILPEEVSPLALHWSYQSSAYLIRVQVETPDESVAPSLATLQK